MSYETTTFSSGGDTCDAWHFQGAGDTLASPAGRPVVVMAHGVGGTKDSGLEPYADGLSKAGLDVFAFDYRGFGASGGTPRQTVSMSGQLEDYRSAMAAAARLPGVDPNRLVLWGVSLAGGHVLAAGAGRDDVAAVVSLTPLVDGLAAGRLALTHHKKSTMLRSTAAGVRSRVASGRGRAPVMMPLVGRPGDVACLSLEGHYEDFLAIAGPTWRNEVDASVGLELGRHRPGKAAADLRCPLLVQIADFDRSAPPHATAKVAFKGRAQVRHYPCDHFDVWPGKPWFEPALAHQVAFLSRALAPLISLPIMLLAEVVATSADVASTRSRKAKVGAIAMLLAHAATDEIEIVTAFVGGQLRQRRTGLGWRAVSALPEAASSPSLTVVEVDDAFAAIASTSGAGSQATRASAVAELFGRATASEQAWLRGVVTGAVRQGALDALVQEAVAAAAVPLASVRRAAMLAGSTVAVVRVAFTTGVSGLAEIGLEVGRPVLPMLASSAPSLADALAKTGGPSAGEVAVDVKLDGIRIQVHRSGSSVLVATRTLEDITARLPEVVALALSLPAASFVLDGEAMLIGPDGRPRPFQETASRTASASGGAVTSYFFDVLHVDGVDLLDAPARERQSALERLVPASSRAPRLVTTSPAEAESFLTDALSSGHEGVVVKNLAAPYDAGRRGASWVKVKPVHTLDLVVLAVEWGSGRREGWLSNIHLGARDPAGGFVMLGKTFKGMTDEMLAWQTERFLALETARSSYVVTVRPEQVVEIAVDGLQRSTRYPGGLALRFARVVRYRDDKTAAQADTIEVVRELFER